MRLSDCKLVRKLYAGSFVRARLYAGALVWGRTCMRAHLYAGALVCRREDVGLLIIERLYASALVDRFAGKLEYNLARLNTGALACENACIRERALVG